MTILVTGSAGHLGEGLVRTLRQRGDDVVGVDIQPSAWTDVVGSVSDPAVVARCMDNVDTVYHTATLHKPHVVTHTQAQFVDTNISGTLVLLQAAAAARVRAFVFTSTTSVYGQALRPEPPAPAAWVTEALQPVPRNIYGVTKLAAENLCHLYHQQQQLDCIVLRTSRFFSEADDDPDKRASFPDANIKLNEYLFRRVELEDVVTAHLLAAQRAPELGFGRYIVSATSPFTQDDLEQLNTDASQVVAQRVPGFDEVFRQQQWRMFERIDRVYVNDAARRDLLWQPRYTFDYVLANIDQGRLPVSELAASVGTKPYHEQTFADGLYPVESC